MQDVSEGRTDLQRRLAQLLDLLKRMNKAERDYQRAIEMGQPVVEPLKYRSPAKRLVLILLLALPAIMIAAFLNYLIVAVPAILCVAFLLVRSFPIPSDGAGRRAAITDIGLYVLFIALTLLTVTIRLAEQANIISWQSSLYANDQEFRPLVLMFLIVTIIVRLVARRRVAANREIELRNSTELEIATRNSEQEIQRVEAEVADIQRAFHAGNFQTLVPAKFMDYESVAALWEILDELRADTLKEAITHLVQDRHNAYMRSSADRQIALSQMQLDEQQRQTRNAQMYHMMDMGMQAFQGSRTRKTIREEGAYTRNTIRERRGF